MSFSQRMKKFIFRRVRQIVQTFSQSHVFTLSPSLINLLDTFRFTKYGNGERKQTSKIGSGGNSYQIYRNLSTPLDTLDCVDQSWDGQMDTLCSRAVNGTSRNITMHAQRRPLLWPSPSTRA